MTTTLDIDLGYEPRAWQAACHMCRKRFTVLVIHPRAGKTVWALMEIFHEALTCPLPNPQYAYIAPHLNQAKRNMLTYLVENARKIPGVKLNLSSDAGCHIVLPNNAKIWIIGADDPDAIRGMYLDGVVLDEVAQMKRSIWGEVIRVRVVDRKGWVIFIGTPKGTNLFSEIYGKAQRADPSEWFADLWDYRRTGVIPDEEIEQLRKDMTPEQFRQEMECDFSAANQDALLSLEMVNQSMDRAPREDSWGFAAKVLGVDVAFAESGDRSVMFPRQGLMAFPPEVFRGMDPMQLAAQVARKAEEWSPDAIFVDMGRGEGVYFRLQQLGLTPIGVNFGGSPTSPRFRNKKAEMYFAIKDWIMEGGALPRNPDIAIDLTSLRVKQSVSTNRIEIAYEENLPSPDLAAGLALTFAQPVQAPVRNRHDYETRRYGLKPGKAKTGRSDDFYRV